MPCSTETHKVHTLLADSITLSFGRQNVLNGAWLRSQTGRVTGLLGRNGSGKSSMFRAVMGQLKAQNCFVRVDDETVSDALQGGSASWLPWSVTGGLFRNSSVARCLKYLPQGNFLPPKMTLRRIFEYYSMDYGELTEAFPKFAQYQDAQVRELSFGEVRIAGIWLVLCSPSPFCILDEPFSFLAPVAVERIQDLIRRQKSSKGIILSDHNYNALLEVSDEVLLLSDGYVHQVRDRSDLVRYGYCR